MRETGSPDLEVTAMKLTTATTATGSFHTITWTAGPMDQPERTFRHVTQVTSLDAYRTWIDKLQDEGRAPVLGFVADRMLRTGQEVWVHAYGTRRQGFVTGFTRSKVAVDLLKNQQGERIERAFSHHEVHLAGL